MNVEFLFLRSQNQDARENLLEELQDALSGEEPCAAKCSDLKKLLKSIGVDAKVNGCEISYSAAEDYQEALEVLSSNLNDLADGGWVYAPSGEVNSANCPPKFVITFQQITVADDDNEKSDKVDIDKLIDQARELGMAPEGDDLKDELDDKYADFLKENETAGEALLRMLEAGADKDQPKNWKVKIFDDEGAETEAWKIDDRTEDEAREEAESDPAVQGAHRWTLTSAEISEGVR